jgi:hypothetical protein
MAPTFEYIEPHIKKIRDYIFGDLGRITNVELGCNYTAAGIMDMRLRFIRLCQVWKERLRSEVRD